MTNLEELERRVKTANNLTRSLNNYRSAIKDSRCDKYGIGFNLDRRFSSATVELSIDSWTGYYGSSGSSKSISIYDKKLFNSALLKVLNKNFDAIINEVSELLIDESLKYKEKAINELQSKLDKINKLNPND